MTFLAYFHSLAAKFFRRSETADDMEEELHSHMVRLQGCSTEFWRAGCWLLSCIRNSPRSAGTGGAVLTMLLLGLLATWIPARRALSVDPMMLLRED